MISVFASYNELIKSKQKRVQRYKIINELLFQGVLMSYNRYNEDEAKEKYIKAIPKPKKRATIVQVKKEIAPKPPKPKKIKINPVYMYNSEGELVNKFLNPQQMANKLCWNYSTVFVYSAKENVYDGYLLTRKPYEQEKAKELYLFKTTPKEKPVKEKKIKPKTPKEKKQKQPRPIREKPPKQPKQPKEPYIQLHPIYQYNKDGELIYKYNNSTEAEEKTGFNGRTLRQYAKKEKVYKGFLWAKTDYPTDEVKQRFTEALNRQQMTYIYKGGELVAMFSTLAQVRQYIKSEETLKKISYYKEIHKPIGDYILSNRPLDI